MLRSTSDFENINICFIRSHEFRLSSVKFYHWFLKKYRIVVKFRCVPISSYAFRSGRVEIGSDTSYVPMSSVQQLCKNKQNKFFRPEWDPLRQLWDGSFEILKRSLWHDRLTGYVMILPGMGVPILGRLPGRPLWEGQGGRMPTQEDN